MTSTVFIELTLSNSFSYELKLVAIGRNEVAYVVAGTAQTHRADVSHSVGGLSPEKRPKSRHWQRLLVPAYKFVNNPAYARMSCTTFPWTSVRRKSRPAWRYVRRS